ncbi:unnamed protein product [Schistocephalus solidus]|uniref:Syndetin C-terminal domain-containing protein n=1 Tax=Schistocephalus solidus TaxID=70667 RepID=A0A3P7BKU1_SCHSO|nr:unnamed protein product [Schistocephalus solidus]
MTSAVRHLGATPAARTAIWRGTLHWLSSELLEGIATVNECSEEGRSQMLLDVQSTALLCESESGDRFRGWLRMNSVCRRQTDTSIDGVLLRVQSYGHLLNEFRVRSSGVAPPGVGQDWLTTANKPEMAIPISFVFAGNIDLPVRLLAAVWLLAPFVNLDFLVDYIQAFYVPIREWEAWLMSQDVTKRYSQHQLTGLASCLSRGDRKTRQRLINIVNQMYPKKPV